MKNPTEVAAKIIYETWGGSWEAASEGRKAQAREEASKVLSAIRYDLAERLIVDLSAHDGAEGFSVSTYKMLEEWEAA